MSIAPETFSNQTTKTVFTDPFSKEIFESTYSCNGENIDETHSRIAKALASVEKENAKEWQQKFEILLRDFKFVPGGRITSNAGTDFKGASLINCFVSGFQGEDQDSMKGITDELQRQALILSSEGGYGFCADVMRPRGAVIRGTGAISPGAVDMLKMWDKSSEVITSGGVEATSGLFEDQEVITKNKIRKGAQMVTMSCWHPDVVRFIEAKKQAGNLTKFNMSVLITDEFLDALEKGHSWNLEFPDYIKEAQAYKKHWDGNLKKWKEAGRPVLVFHRFEKAQELWDLIMTNTYNRNEPGVLQIDTINKMNNLHYTEHINATNPCVTADTLIQTGPNQYQQVLELVGVQFGAYINGSSFPSAPQGFFSTGVKDTYTIEFVVENGFGIEQDAINVRKINATSNHQFMTSSGEWRTVQELINQMTSGPSVIDSGGLPQHEVYLRFGDILSNQKARILRIDYNGQEEVYDCSIYNINSYISNGLVSHNCGEQVLPIGGVCLLGSLNLYKFLTEPNTENSYTIDGVKYNSNIWDLDMLAKYIPYAVRFLDNVNDITYVPLPEQRENLKNKRRIGMGVLGYASSLMRKKIRYGSEKALAETNSLMKFISHISYTASSDIAVKKGSFLEFDADKYTSSGYIQNVLPQIVIDRIKKQGMRNSHVLSIQPTGNSSIFANNVSGGLEPIFMTEYIRTSGISCKTPEGLDLPKNVNWDSQTGDYDPDKWTWKFEGDDPLLKTEFDGYIWKYDRSRGLVRETLVQDSSVRELKELGEWNPNAEWAATTPQLNVDDHVNTMKIFAKYIDSAASKTVNLPNDYPYEEFKDVYLKAFKAGIKGFTTYRDGTMATVLSAVSDDKSEGSKNRNKGVFVRPDVLDCTVRIVTFRGEKYIVIIGFLDDNKDEPIEVFAFRSKGIRFTKEIENGKMRKVQSEVEGNPSTYNLETEHLVIEDVQKHFDQGDEQGVISRMISLSLRTGASIADIYTQLMKSNGDVMSYSRVIARVIARYINQEDIKDILMCNECGDRENVVFQEGCVICMSCGNSGCN